MTTAPLPASRKTAHAEWLGDLPSHWTEVPLKHVCRRSAVYGLNESAESYQSNGVRFLRTTDITDSGDLSDATPVYMAPEMVRDYLLEDGDLLLSRSGTIGRSFLYSAGRHGPCSHAGYLVRFSFKPICWPKFFFYVTKSKPFTDWLSFAVIQSTIGNVNGQKYAGFSFALPPLIDQQSIAAFLDWKTAQIDQLIAKKQRMIELLKEKRQALISQAVTKGLDPRSQSTPTGWQVGRLKFRMKKIGQGWSPQCEGRQAEIGEWGVLKVGCMNSDIYNEAENKALPPTEKPEQELEVRVGDVLMSRSNTIELVGSVGIVHQTQGRILLCDKLYRLVFDHSKLRPEYAVHLLRSHLARTQIERDASGASPSMKNISNDRVADLLLPFPPIDDQRQIIAWIKGQTGHIDKVANVLQRQLGKLHEYRQTLISAAVTGKLRTPAMNDGVQHENIP